ncbi:spermatogenesis-associated protein 20 [Radiomyces spectabilis]|uniref:spermatogenesis-associated protein 20 n=1 Tax=Radiomyces spectabilis TaxID=64574 RepID=UPI0022210092|nr:spermatogenesis-associated protein 20 [Radiomyces spectabilis]KAI8377645.1 spermatogenesis-associated protein 20 [Radiomyces spectabilis]
MSEHKYTNRLATEKSPYLLQHAHNPVDWYPWGEEAFQKSRDENKPIFLSVGYSTCHWCHVMEHESFENEEVAALMNKHFVNIKVDREENPGVDKLYMTFVQLSSGGGGWPMSVFLTPELYPFFGATYFPPNDQFGRPGFKTLLTRIAQVWNISPDKVRSSGESMISQIKTYVEAKPSASSKELDANAVAEETYSHFAQSFDDKYGGFGTAPKFPTPVQLNFLLNYYAYNHKKPEKSKEAKNALEMTLFTLKQIAAGGIHDHVGSGFHRYSTDKKWHVPHFEKMLYDQAQLLSVYSAAYQITNDSLYAEVARDIVKYIARDLRHSDGAFYSAEDADSYPSEKSAKKLEGAFCVWEELELQRLLDEDEVKLFVTHYGVKSNGNVDPAQDPHDELRQKNVLMEQGRLEESAQKIGIDVDRAKQLIQQAKDKLWNHRVNARPKPHRDDKILTSWNGLMITGLSHAYQALGDQECLSLAIEAATFIEKNLYQQETKTLLRSFCGGPSAIEGFVDDYSYLIQGLLNLYEASFDERWVQWAFDLQERQNELFYDKDQGGYFNVAGDDKNILLRLKEEQDGAEPSANAVSLYNLICLGTLFDHRAYQKHQQEVVNAFYLALSKFPFALPALVSSFLVLSNGLKEIVITGHRENKQIESFIQLLSQSFTPNKLMILAREDGNIASKNSVVGEITRSNQPTPSVYICENFTCGLPITDINDLKAKLAS